VLPEAAVAAASSALQSALPNLKVYCISGPGLGSCAYPARWLHVWQDETGDGVSPILLDEIATNSGIVMSSSSAALNNLLPKMCSTNTPSHCPGISRANLLQPQHKLQPLGCLLVSPAGEASPVDSRISNINSRLLQVLFLFCLMCSLFLDFAPFFSAG
jgi:hypothetical protein